MTLSVAQLDRSSLERAPPLIDSLFRGEPHAAIVRGVLSPDEAALVVRALEAAPGVRERLHPESDIEFVGKPLQWSKADRALYLDAADHVRSVCSGLLAEIPLLQRVAETLAVATGRPVRTFSDEDGREYAPITLRRIPSGAFVGPHFELGQLGFPPYSSVINRIDRATLFSFYVVLQVPERGGELAAYPLRYGDPDAARVLDRDDASGALFGTYEPTLIAPPPGDMLLFDSGRHAHAVRRVGGSIPRWTAGGLVAFERDHEAMLSWA